MFEKRPQRLQYGGKLYDIYYQKVNFDMAVNKCNLASVPSSPANFEDIATLRYIMENLLKCKFSLEE